MINVFYLPFGYRGFTKELLIKALSEIEGRDYSGIFYLAPTTRKIRGAQKTFHLLTDGFYIQPGMMTLKQLSGRFHSLYGKGNLISAASVPVFLSRMTGKGIGFSSVISGFISEIKQYRPPGDINSVAAELRQAFGELNVPDEALQRAINALDIFKAYQKKLEENDVMDDDDLLGICPSLLDKDKSGPQVLVLDGFYEVTPAEELILKKLIEKAANTLIAIPHSNNFAGITGRLRNFLKDNFDINETALACEKKPLKIAYVSYPSMDEEVEGIARHIKNLHIAGKSRPLDNVYLTFPKLDAYAELIERVFKRYGVPLNFSSSRPAGRTRPFMDLLAMMESVAEDFPRLPFSQFLVSPYFKKLPVVFREWIPLVSLHSGTIKGKDSWLNLSRILNPDHAGLRDALPDLEKELGVLFKKFYPLLSLKDRGSFSQFSDALMKIAADLGFSDGEKDITEILSHAAGELAFLDALSDSRTDIRVFIDGLRFLLNASGTETEGSGVQATGFFELRGSETESLYFGGLRDGDLPSMPSLDHILPDSVRTRMGFVNMKKYLLLQKFIFERLLESSGNLHLSYPSMEADKLFLPSPFLPWKCEIKEDIPGILCREEALVREGIDPLTSEIREIRGAKNESLKKRFGEKSHIRVTDIDSYRTCPRKFFIEKILGLEPKETKEYEVEARLLGTIIHKIMEELIPAQFTDMAEMRARAESLLKKHLKDFPIESYWKNFIEHSFLSILPDIHELECELRDEGYSFMRSELSVEGEIIKGIRLRGKIDRVDRKDDSVEIIDYKTGSAQLSGPQVVETGATLQLFLYAAIMKSLGFNVGRVGIYSLKDVSISWLPKSGRREKLTIEDYIKESLKYLEKTVSAMRKGDFTAMPLTEQTCRNCHERAYCPYIQTDS